MIHTTNPVIKHKAGLLNLAEELSNVSKAGQDYETPPPERTDARYFLSIAALLIFLLIPYSASEYSQLYVLSLKIAHPLDEAFMKFFWIDTGYNSGNSIMNRNTVIEITILL